MSGQGSADGRPSSLRSSSLKSDSTNRHRRAALNSAALLLARLVRAGAQLAVARLAVQALGQADYGLWLTVSSVVSYLTLTNLGTNNSVLTAVAEARGRNERRALQAAVASGFVPVAVLGCALGVSATLGYIGVRAFAARQVEPVIASLVLVLAWNSISGVIAGQLAAVQVALQEDYRGSLWSATGAVLGLVALVLAMRRGGGLLTWAVVFVLSVQVPSWLNLAQFFLSRTRRWMISFAAFDIRLTKLLMSDGAWFTLGLLAQVVILNSDSIVIAHALGTSAVVPYAVTFQLCTFASTFAAVIPSAYRPALTEAAAAGEAGWARTAAARSVGMTSAMASGAGVAIALWGQDILDLWLGGAVVLDPRAHWALGCFLATSSWNTALGVVAFSMNATRAYTLVVLAEAAVKLVGALVLVRVHGLFGVALANLAASLLVTAWALPTAIRRTRGPMFDRPAAALAAKAGLPAAGMLVTGVVVAGALPRHWPEPLLLGLPIAGSTVVFTGLALGAIAHEARLLRRG